MKIEGGYYIKARRIQESEIAHAPPHVREIWDWLILNALWKDGRFLKRGQVLATYGDIRDGLHWMVGYRKMTYSKNNCETAMNWLMAHTMVHTTKTTRGLIISIVNFAKYQDFDNYEPYNETYTKHTRDIQPLSTIEKERKERKEGSKEHTHTSLDWVRTLPEGDRSELQERYRVDSSTVHACAEDLIDYCEAKGKTYKDYRAALRNFIKSHVARHPECVIRKIEPVVSAIERTPEEQARINAKLQAVRGSLAKSFSI